MKRCSTAFVLLLLCAIAIAQQPPSAGTALRDGRAAIEAKDYATADRVLSAGLDAAAGLPPAERSKAEAALNFYNAVAAIGLKDEAAARKHLIEFFRLSPQSKTIDASKYDPAFVRLFKEMTSTEEVSGATFEAYYAKPASTIVPMEPVAQAAWAEAPAVEILGTRDEKSAFQSTGTAEERAKFLDEFWRRRDPKGGKDGDFHRTFLQRVAFADDMFGDREMRGSLTDRGRVYVILGRPSMVKRRPISREDVTGPNAVWLPYDTMLNGTFEQWVYAREMLPVPITKKSVTYRFVTQEGLGVGTLQTEGYSANVMQMVATGSTK